MAGSSGGHVLAEGPAHPASVAPSAASAPCSPGAAPALAATAINVRPEAVGSRRQSLSRAMVDIVRDSARAPPSLT